MPPKMTRGYRRNNDRKVLWRNSEPSKTTFAFIDHCDRVLYRLVCWDQSGLAIVCTMFIRFLLWVRTYHNTVLVCWCKQNPFLEQFEDSDNDESDTTRIIDSKLGTHNGNKDPSCEVSSMVAKSKKAVVEQNDAQECAFCRSEVCPLGLHS